MLRTGPGLAALAIVTAVCFAARVGFAIPCLLYVLIVVLQSLWSPFAAAAIVSLIAAAALDYFFIPPILHWQIYDPEYGVALVTYLATSLVVTRLSSKARAEAREAERRRRDAGLLYDVASRLLSLAPEDAAGPESLRIFREVFGLRAVCFFDAATGRLQVEGNSVLGLAEKTRQACLDGADRREESTDLYIRCLYTRGAIAGTVGFEGRIDDPAIALALSVLAATALERTRSFSSAAEAAANAHAEMLRSAILDAFAHEFKTPLAVILAAAGGLRETADQAEQIEMTDIIENQTVRLNQLTTRLLRTARLDRDDVTPTMEPTGFGSLVSGLIEQYRTVFGRRIVGNSGRGPEIMADPELLSLAVNQLLDNACKYSPAERLVKVDLEVSDGYADLRVTNEGSSIRPEERERIFERFFRGADTDQVAAGAGIGLYVARKIVRAHGGSLELEHGGAVPASTTFRIRLPLLRKETKYEQETHQGVAGGR